ncbi:MAG: major capsid protein P2 [Gammaproteobacteria bacterium]|nr:major capsid protein P2 [Gammaproteobacteria bacterium]
MARFTPIELPSFSPVAAGVTVTLGCPTTRTYEKIILKYGGTFTRAQMKNIRVEVNGKPMMEFKDGDELDAINDYYGRADVAGYLTIYFNRPEMDYKPGMQKLCGLGTADVDTLQLRIDVDAGATNPTLEAHAVTSDPTPMGAITKVKAFPASFATSGEQAIDNLPRGPRIIALHLFKSDVEAVSVEVNGRKIAEGIKALHEQVQKEAGRVPQTASATHVDFCLDGNLAEALVTDRKAGVEDLRIRPTLTTSGAVRLVVEYLDGFQGI